MASADSCQRKAREEENRVLWCAMCLCVSCVLCVSCACLHARSHAHMHRCPVDCDRFGCTHAQAAINAAFADDGELLFVGSSATPVCDGEAVQVRAEPCEALATWRHGQLVRTAQVAHGAPGAPDLCTSTCARLPTLNHYLLCASRTAHAQRRGASPRDTASGTVLSMQWTCRHPQQSVQLPL